MILFFSDSLKLEENLKKLEKFWKEIEFYRNNDIKSHPKFPKPKNILDLMDKLTYDSSEESETLVLADYSIKEPECKSKKNIVVNVSVKNKNPEYIMLDKYSIKDI